MGKQRKGGGEIKPTPQSKFRISPSAAKKTIMLAILIIEPHSCFALEGNEDVRELAPRGRVSTADPPAFTQFKIILVICLVWD